MSNCSAKYTVESLVKINPVFNAQHYHGIQQSDVDMANKYVSIIESRLSSKQIQHGDIVELTTKNGAFYSNARIESYDAETGIWSVCAQPSSTFASLKDDEVRFHTSGGGWHGIGVTSDLVHVGTREVALCDFGSAGAVGQGAVYFSAIVNVWEYAEPDPIHGEYTTKLYDKHFINYSVDKRGNPKNGSTYRYFDFSRSMVWATKAEYEVWRDTYKGVEFKDSSYPNCTIVFRYKTVEVLISKEEYDKLVLPIDTRMCNGTIEVKVLYDNEAKTVTEYRHTNCGSELYKKGERPFRLARGGQV